MIGKPIFDYPPERRAREGESCTTCGIVLEVDAIGDYCSPECCKWPDRCAGCQLGPTWCTCEHTHCTDCGDPLPDRDRESGFRTCRHCAVIYRQARFDTHPLRRNAPNKEIT